MRIFVLIVLILTGLASAVYAQVSPSALVRGAEGMSPIAYYELSQEANRFFQARDYAGAAEAYDRLTKAYPFEGETWRRLGVSLYQTQKYREAANAYVKADEMGVSPYPQTNAANAALAFARAGESERALDWLETAINKYRHQEPLTLLRNNAFSNLRQNPRFVRLAPPSLAEKTTRDAGWKTDVDRLLSEMRRFRPEFYGQKRELPNNLLQAAARLKRRISQLTDVQIAVELQKLVAILGGSHTQVNIANLPERFGRSHPLPVAFYLFPDGVYVVNSSDDKFRALIGARVTEIDGMPTAKVLETIRPLKQTSEGEEHRFFDMFVLALPHVLHAAGIARKPDEVNLTIIEQNGAKRTIAVGASPNARLQSGVTASATTDAPAPLYLSRGDERYWFEPLSAQKAVYVNFRSVFPKENGESIAEFGRSVRRFLDEHREIKNAIVDIRLNSGGNTFLYPELLRTLIAFDAREGNRVFVITGRVTGSAAMNFAIDLDRLTNAIFVGEATAASVLQNGNPVVLKLPYSELDVLLSTVEWNISSPGDVRRWIAPDVPVVLTAEDYFANRDPAMEAIMTLIEKDGKQ